MYPHDSSTWGLLKAMGERQEMLRSYEARLASAHMLQMQNMLIHSPNLEVLRALQEGIKTHDLAAIAAEKSIGQLLSLPRVGQGVMDLLDAKHRIPSASIDAFLPSFTTYDALSRATVAIKELSTSGPLGDIAFNSMQATVTLTLGMTSLVERRLAETSVSYDVGDLWDSRAEISTSSSNVWQRLARNPASLMELPEFLREVPVLHVFEATRSTGLLLIEEPELIEIEAAPGLIKVEAGDLFLRLKEIHPKLAEKYQGALEVFARRGSDYVSQLSVSFRELYKHLFEIIAPRAAIAAWRSDVIPAKGPMTNKASLRYIYRGQETTGYARMTNNEIEMVEQNLILLNEGVHCLDPRFEYENVRALVRRCEYCLLSILHAHDLSNR